MKMKLGTKLALFAVCASAGTALAGPLPYGTGGAPAVAASPGVTMLAEMSSPFSVTNGKTIDGRIVSSVWSSAGGLTFVYQVIQTSAATTSIESFTIAGWSSLVTIFDFGQEVGSVTPGVPPPGHAAGTEMAGFVNRPGGGEEKLNISATGIGASESGFWMWFHTDATSYSTNIATVQDGGVSQGGLPVFVPIPLPAGSGMAGAGLACLFGVGYIQRRRRRNG